MATKRKVIAPLGDGRARSKTMMDVTSVEEDLRALEARQRQRQEIMARFERARQRNRELSGNHHQGPRRSPSSSSLPSATDSSVSSSESNKIVVMRAGSDEDLESLQERMQRVQRILLDRLAFATAADSVGPHEETDVSGSSIDKPVSSASLSPSRDTTDVKSLEAAPVVGYSNQPTTADPNVDNDSDNNDDDDLWHSGLIDVDPFTVDEVPMEPETDTMAAPPVISGIVNDDGTNPGSRHTTEPDDDDGSDNDDDDNLPHSGLIEVDSVTVNEVLMEPEIDTMGAPLAVSGIVKDDATNPASRQTYNKATKAQAPTTHRRGIMEPAVAESTAVSADAAPPHGISDAPAQEHDGLTPAQHRRKELRDRCRAAHLAKEQEQKHAKKKAKKEPKARKEREADQQMELGNGSNSEGLDSTNPVVSRVQDYDAKPDEDGDASDGANEEPHNNPLRRDLKCPDRNEKSLSSESNDDDKTSVQGDQTLPMAAVHDNQQRSMHSSVSARHNTATRCHAGASVDCDDDDKDDDDDDDEGTTSKHDSASIVNSADSPPEPPQPRATDVVEETMKTAKLSWSTVSGGAAIPYASSTASSGDSISIESDGDNAGEPPISKTGVARASYDLPSTVAEQAPTPEQLRRQKLRDQCRMLHLTRINSSRNQQTSQRIRVSKTKKNLGTNDDDNSSLGSIISASNTSILSEAKHAADISKESAKLKVDSKGHDDKDDDNNSVISGISSRITNFLSDVKQVTMPSKASKRRTKKKANNGNGGGDDDDDDASSVISNISASSASASVISKTEQSAERVKASKTKKKKKCKSLSSNDEDSSIISNMSASSEGIRKRKKTKKGKTKKKKTNAKNRKDDDRTVTNADSVSVMTPNASMASSTNQETARQWHAWLQENQGNGDGSQEEEQAEEQPTFSGLALKIQHADSNRELELKKEQVASRFIDVPAGVYKDDVAPETADDASDSDDSQRQSGDSAQFQTHLNFSNSLSLIAEESYLIGESGNFTDSRKNYNFQYCYEPSGSHNHSSVRDCGGNSSMRLQKDNFALGDDCRTLAASTTQTAGSEFDDEDGDRVAMLPSFSKTQKKLRSSYRTLAFGSSDVVVEEQGSIGHVNYQVLDEKGSVSQEFDGVLQALALQIQQLGSGPIDSNRSDTNVARSTSGAAPDNSSVNLTMAAPSSNPTTKSAAAQEPNGNISFFRTGEDSLWIKSDDMMQDQNDSVARHSNSSRNVPGSTEGEDGTADSVAKGSRCPPRVNSQGRFAKAKVRIQSDSRAHVSGGPGCETPPTAASSGREPSFEEGSGEHSMNLQHLSESLQWSFSNNHRSATQDPLQVTGQLKGEQEVYAREMDQLLSNLAKLVE